MKQLLKKFKNFRLTAIIEAILGVVAVAASLVILILYQTNQTRVSYEGLAVPVTGFDGEPLPGMVFFLSGILCIIMGIVAAYISLPFIFKKDEKLEPNKALPYFGAVSGFFGLIEVIFAFVMVSKPGSRHTVGIVIFAIVLLLALICQLAMLYPAIKVRIKKDEE